MSDEDSLHSPSDHLEGSEAPKKNDAPAGTKAETRIEFSEEDMKILLENGEHICKIPPENVASAWKAWAHEIDVSFEFNNSDTTEPSNHLIGTTTYRATMARLLGEKRAPNTFKEGQ